MPMNGGSCQEYLASLNKQRHNIVCWIKQVDTQVEQIVLSDLSSLGQRLDCKSTTMNTVYT